jgi:flagellar motor switch protein FliN/FliY
MNTVASVILPDFSDSAPAGKPRPLETLANAMVTVSAVSGKTQLTLGELTALKPGQVITFDQAADTAVDVLVNGHRVATGDVIVQGSSLAVRVSGPA